MLTIYKSSSYTKKECQKYFHLHQFPNHPNLNDPNWLQQICYYLNFTIILTSWFVLIYFCKLTWPVLQICFNFITKGLKRAEVSSFWTISIVLSRSETSLISRLNSVLIHPSNKFFCYFLLCFQLNFALFLGWCLHHQASIEFP